MADENSNFPGSKPKESWMVVDIHVGRDSQCALHARGPTQHVCLPVAAKQVGKLDHNMLTT
jgi:hypothetical protein